MEEKPKKRGAEAARILIVLASVVLVVAGAKASADFVVPLLLAFFIATVSYPITYWLSKHRVPRVLAVFFTVLIDFAFLAGVVLVGIMLVGELQNKWESKYYELTKTRVTQLADNVSSTMDRFGMLADQDKNAVASGEESAPLALVVPEPDIFDTEGDVVASQVTEVENLERGDAVVALTQSNLDILSDELLKHLSVNKVLQMGTDFLGKLVSFLGTTFLVLLLTVFMLSEARMFARRFNAICEAKGPNLQRMVSATRDIQRYLGIKTLISLTTGFLAGVLCWAVGLEFPLLWGILAFALNYIPAIGSVMAGIPPVLLSLLLTGDIKDAVIVAAGYLAINGVLGNFLEPTLLGRRFGMSTLVVVVSVLFWGWIWGPIGMLLAVPLTMLVKVALDNSADFRWIAVAISQEDKQGKSHEVEEIKEAIAEAEAHKQEKEEEERRKAADLTKMFPEAE
ncbi:AI-2E family transporter [Rubritalea marina]|uniref:AI-2E family transporter n=1 Tax=Rubritalea marina TaxID=361055 RepID=UPI00036160DF|nr:AI-2E family transporter [Rubritalea marina]